MTINPPGDYELPGIDYTKLDYSRLDYTKIDPSKLNFGALIAAHGRQVEVGSSALGPLLQKYFPQSKYQQNVILMAPGDSGDEKPEMFVYKPPTYIHVEKEKLIPRDSDHSEDPARPSEDDDGRGPDTRTVVFGRVSDELLVELRNLASYSEGDEFELYARKPFWLGDLFVEPNTNSPSWERIVADADSG